MRKVLVIVSVLCVLVGGLCVIVMKLERPTPPVVAPTVRVETDEDKRARTDEYNRRAALALRFDQSTARLLNDPLDRSQYSEEMLILDNPASSEAEVKGAIFALMSSLRYLSRGGSFSAGLNVEVTNALLGKNACKVGFIPADSPRINEYGQLVDDYGSPYWFHSEGANDLTITSAGADRLLHTDDDEHYPPLEVTQQ